jgi:hypothetical protein
LTFPIRHYRPERRRRLADGLYWSAPSLIAAGAMIGHLIAAVWR